MSRAEGSKECGSPPAGISEATATAFVPAASRTIPAIGGRATLTRGAFRYNAGTGGGTPLAETETKNAARPTTAKTARRIGMAARRIVASIELLGDNGLIGA